MSSSTVAILICIIAIISFILERIPLAMTALLAALAMGIFIPEMSLSNIYSGFGSSTVMLAVGMGIVGDALFETGVAEKLGNTIVKSPIAKNERLFVIVIVAICAVMSAFLSNVGTIAMFIPLIGVAAAQSKGKIRNKMVVIAAGMGTAVGGAGTLVGSTAQQVANSALTSIEGFEDGLSLFSMSKVTFPLILITIIYFGTIGYSIMKKVFGKQLEDEVQTDINDKESKTDFDNVSSWKRNLTVLTLLFCIIGFILTSFKPFNQYLDIGVVSLIGAAILIVSGCVPLKESLMHVDWNTVIILGACTGFAKGLDVSGGGAVIANAVLNMFGGESASPVTLMIVGIVVCVVLTNFMTNTSLAAMMTPIYIQMALELGISPVPFVIAIGCIATNMATATPVGTTAVTMTLPAGYKYMDYVKVGGLLNIILLIATCVLSPVVYL